MVAQEILLRDPIFAMSTDEKLCVDILALKFYYIDHITEIVSPNMLLRQCKHHDPVADLLLTPLPSKSKDAEIERLRAEQAQRPDTFLSVFHDFINLLRHPAVMIICACVWLMIWAINQLPTEINQPRVILDPAHKYNVTIASTAEQLFSLQTQLEVRMTQHNVVMSQNLDNFTTILTDITADADLAADYIQFLFKIIDLGADRTAADWQGDADMLVKEAKKLGNVAVSDEIRMKVEAVTHIAGTIAAEMADMEHFLRDAGSASNILLNRLGSALDDNLVGHIGEEPRLRLQQPIIDASISDLNTPVAQLQPGQTMQWSWDEMNKFGDVRRTTGDFTPAQQVIIESKHSILPPNSPVLCLLEYHSSCFPPQHTAS